MMKTVFSFYCDDTNPYTAPPEAFETFLNFVQAEGIAGKSSAILGWGWPAHGILSQRNSEVEQAYIEQLRRAYRCGVDTHFELMTHSGRFDFANHLIPEGAIHEGLWLYEPDVSVAAYEDYFRRILAEGEKVGVKFSGMTWPGCGCEACTRRYDSLNKSGHTEPNLNVWQALLNLAQADLFRSHTVPCFFGGAVEQASAQLMAGSGSYGVYTLPPNAEDRMGLWLNSPEYADADYYIRADGQAGRMVELVRAGVPYVLFYCHWQGLNPANGVGWQVFKEMVRRVQRYLKDEVTWMRPSAYTDHLIGTNQAPGTG